MSAQSITTRIIQKPHRVPAPSGAAGDGAGIARQLDVALMRVGFKLSAELLRSLSVLHPIVVKETADVILAAVREAIGDHVRHNVYFRDFPRNVPDTLEFWTRCIEAALRDPNSAEKVFRQLSRGVVNLLDLPKYGRYLHSYDEMLAAHEEFIPTLKDRMTVLHLGKPLAQEALELYWSLAASPIPLGEDDRRLLSDLAYVCLDDPQPDSIPIRENRAIINQVRLENYQGLLVDTVTDVLRLACTLSGGDVTLETPTKFSSFPRQTRGALMAALEDVVSASPVKLADVNRYREPWKRLGERLHPHEFVRCECAREVFAVARGEKTVRSLAARVEIAFGEGHVEEAIALLEAAPGMLFRSLDRVLRSATDSEIELLLEAVRAVIGRVSGRVILSTREHLQNRIARGTSRIFANRAGRAWVCEDNREPLDTSAIERLLDAFDAELLRRLPETDHLVVDPAVLTLALPLSDKTKAGGFGIMPRGSTVPVEDGILRFFVYWREQSQRTDYDLSVLLLDENFLSVGQRSWTHLSDRDGIAVHSGDITSAPHGATEFIDIDLRRVNCTYVVPQVNIYSGESFLEAAECFFGFMERRPEQEGKPFEAATVRVKSDLYGRGRVALPLVFGRDDGSAWKATWLHLYLSGGINFNRVEANRGSTALLVRSSVERDYLTLAYLVGLLRRKAESFSWYDPGQKLAGPVVFIGVEAPEDLPVGSRAYALHNLQDLLPA